MRKMLSFYLISEVFLSVGLGIFQYAQPFFYASGHIGDQRIGYLFAINAFFGGMAALVTGPVADKVGATRMFKVGTLLIGVGCLLTSATYHLSVWFVATAISGIGGAALMSTENVVLSSLVSGYEKSHLISRFTAFYMVFIGIGAILSGRLVEDVGLQDAMWIGALMTLVAPIIRVFVKAPDVRRDRVLRWPSKPLLLMATYAAIFGVASGAFNPFSTLILSTTYHATTWQTSLVYASSLFMVALGSFLVRPLIQKLRQQATLSLAFGLCTATSILFLVTVSMTLFVAVYFAWTIVTAVPQPIVDAIFLEIVHASEFSQMFGTRVFGTRVGNAIGASVGGGLLKHGYAPYAFLLSALFFVLAYVYLAYLRIPLAKLSRRSLVSQGDERAM